MPRLDLQGANPMKQTLRTFSAAWAAALGLGVLGSVSLCASTSSAAQEILAPPPPEYIATTEPVYYEGRAAYWYGNRWYSRDGGAWNYYHGEPGYLRDWRGRPGWGGR